MLTIRHLKTKAELDAYMDLCVYCFSMSSDYIPHYAAFVGGHLDKTWGAFEHGRLVASMWYIPFEMNVVGAHLGMGGVAAVVTAPHVRNRGLAKSLMSSAHKQMRSEGCPLATLMPFKPEFYARMGYGDVFYHQDCLIVPGSVASRDLKAYAIEPVDGLKEWKTFDRLYQDGTSQCFGAVKRDATYWKLRYLTSSLGSRQHYLIRKSGKPHGFLITHLDKPVAGWEPDLSRESRLGIVQAIWNDQGAFDAILQFIRGHRDQFSKIRWHLPLDVRLHDRLIDQRIEVQIKPKMMLKLVDLKEALQRRPYDPTVFGEVILEVKGDDTSPWNDGAWRVVWRDGRATVTKATKTPGRRPTARIDIQSLAVLYSGRRSASQLAELGSIRGPLDALRILDDAFPARVPYLQEWF